MEGGWRSTSFPATLSMGTPCFLYHFSKPVQSMGDLPSGSELSMDQRLMQLERWLQEQHDSHQQQIDSFLVAHASLREENATLRNAAPIFPHLYSTAHRLEVPLGRRSPVQFESMEFLSLGCHLRRSRGIPWAEQTPSSRRILDPALWVLDDISTSSFVPALLE